MKWLKGLGIILLVLILSYIAVSLIAPEKVFNLMINLQRGGANLSQKEISTGDYKFIYLETNSAPQGGETIVLLHGFQCNKDYMVPMAKFLKGYHLVIPDIPGFGDTEKNPSLKYDIPSQADRLDRFIKKIGLTKFYMAGNSMGGNIAGVYAASHPDRVRGLVLIDSAGVTMPVKSTFVKQLENHTNPLLISDEKDYDRVIDMVYFKKPFIPFPLKGVMISKAIESRPFNEQITRESLANYALENEIKKITMPVLIIWGENDKLIDVSTVQVLEKGLKNHETKIIKNCGHIPMMERPEETAGYIASFIKSGK